MIKYKKHISKLLSSLFLFLLILFSGSTFYQIKEAKQHIIEQSPILLENAVRKNIKEKSTSIYLAYSYEYNPEKRKIGEYEKRTVRYADTTFTIKKKIRDPGEDVFQGFQTLFVDIKQLHADSIQFLFDNLLKEENIYVESIVGINASFYTKLDEWSGDTTAIDVNCRAGFLNQGEYEDINYYAYIHYSPYTFWRLMSKVPFSILFISCIVTGIALFWWLRKRKREKREGIVLLQDGKYRMHHATYNVQNKTLRSEAKEIQLPQLLHELLLLFLKAENHKADKKQLKQQFWSKNGDSTNNMTSTINRLNKILKEVDCGYTVITDPKDEESYILTH